MTIKVFFLITLFLLNLKSDFIESRELSIQQLEERKKADRKRELERSKRKKVSFTADVKFKTDIVFFSKERKVPPVLSNLDPILEDEGFYGVKLAIEDNLTTGRFVGHDYEASFHRVGLDEDIEIEFKKLVNNGKKFFVVETSSIHLH